MKIINCPKCGKTFEKKVNNQKYCSDGCRTKARKDSIYAQGNPSASGKYIAPGIASPLSLRFCHDCKKPTTQYRCPACQLAFKRKYDITESILDD